MATPVSDVTNLVIEAELASDRTTKTELRRLLGEQTAALKKLRHPAAEYKELSNNLARAQGAVQSALQDGNSLRAQNRELQRQLSIAQQELGHQERLAAQQAQTITDCIRDHNIQLERANMAERHLRVVLNLADFFYIRAGA